MMRTRSNRNIGVAAIALVLLALSGWLVLRRRPITFNVTALTERIRFVSDTSGLTSGAARDSIRIPRAMWILDDVIIELDDSPAGEQRFTGYFDPADSIDVTIERVANGPLYAEVFALNESANAPSIGRLLDTLEQPVRVLGRRAAFFATDLAERADSGRTVIIPLTGLVEIGTDLGMQTRGTTATLRSGRIKMLGESVLRGSIFEAGSAELAAGDQFTVEEREGPSVGFVMADQEPGMTAAFRTVARRGVVIRPGGGRYELDVSLFDRIYRDRLFQVVAVSVAGLAFLATILNFLIDWISFTREQRSYRMKRAMRRKTRTSVGVPLSPQQSQQDTAETKTAAIVGTLILFLSIAGSVHAQSGVFVKAGDHGQGVLRGRSESCFVLLPNHVVEKAGGDIAITGERGLKAVAVLERTFAGDLAMLRVRSGDALPCGAWPPSFATSLLRQMGLVQAMTAMGPAHLRIVEESGSETRRQVEIRASDEETITIRPRTAADAITQSMSGASLVVGNNVVGLLLNVCPNPAPADNPCTPGDADVLRLDAVSRLTDAFFDVPPAGAQRSMEQTQARNAQVTADGQRQLDAMYREQARVRDSMALAMRGGRAADLPRLQRDVQFALYSSQDPVRLPCDHECRRAWSDFRARPGPYFYATLELAPILSTAPPLTIASVSCTLNSAAGKLRDFNLRLADTVGVAWDGTKGLPVGEYWAACKVDGTDLQSNRVRLARAVLPAGQIQVASGGTLEVKSLEIGIEGSPPVRTQLPKNPIRVAMPTPRRPDAPINVAIEFSETASATPVDPRTIQAFPANAMLQQAHCRVANAGSAQSTLTQIPGGHRVSLVMTPAANSRWRADEYEGTCTAMGILLLRFVLVMQ